MLSWKENYTCGIDSIDNQHKKLLEIGSRVYQMLKNEEKLDKYDDIEKATLFCTKFIKCFC